MLIIICDDDSDHREFRAALLLQRGHVVEQASNVEMALEMLAVQNYDVVVTDYKMPGYTGRDFLTMTRERGVEIPFVLMTNHEEVLGNRQLYYEIGFSLVISKDTHNDHFVEHVEIIFRHWQEPLENV
jgi:CheY-like chemotaxis protein